MLQRLHAAQQGAVPQADLRFARYRAIYPNRQFAEWVEHNHCPVNDQLCEEAVWFRQTMLLGSREDMDQIAGGIRKIQRQAGILAQNGT